MNDPEADRGYCLDSMARPVHWARASCGQPSSDDVRKVTCDDCRALTSYAMAVFAQAIDALGTALMQFVEPVAQAARRVRLAHVWWPPAGASWPGFCEATKTQGGYRWACHMAAGHGGPEHLDRSRGPWRDSRE